MVRWCYEHDVPVVPRGGGTGLVRAERWRWRAASCCSLERLRGVRELEPGLWRMVAEAGVTTRARASPGARERAVLRPGPGRVRAVADRRQRGDERGRAARAEVRRDGRVGERAGGGDGAGRARVDRRLDPQGRGGLRHQGPADRLGGHARGGDGGAPAPAAGAAGGDPARRVPAHARGGLRGDRARCSRRGCARRCSTSSTARRSRCVAAAYPGAGDGAGVPARGGLRADRGGRRHARGGARAAR